MMAKLSDPENCGEDHHHNLSRVTEVAGRYCGDCRHYHITTPLNRLTGDSGWNGRPRKVLIGFMQSFLTNRISVCDPFNVVIAGAADTSILATCAHAVDGVAGVRLENANFTVLDKCRTPLTLCQDFAQVYGLNVSTFQVDLTALVKPHPADVIIFHNTLSFIPPIHRAAILRECGRWLKAGGRIVLWISLFDETNRQKAQHGISVSTKIRAMIEAGTLSINEPLELFIHRLDQLAVLPRANPFPFCSMTDLQELLTESGLPIVSIDTFAQPRPTPDQPQKNRTHALAVLGPSDTN